MNEFSTNQHYKIAYWHLYFLRGLVYTPLVQWLGFNFHPTYWNRGIFEPTRTSIHPSRTNSGQIPDALFLVNFRYEK